MQPLMRSLLALLQTLTWPRNCMMLGRFWETGSATALPATTSASQTSTMAQKSLSSHSSPSSPWTWSTG